MNLKPVILTLLIVVSLTSCVSNRKYVYLQEGDVNKKDLPTDSVLRSYPVSTFDYRIQPNDILSIRAESITEDKFDFFTTSQGNGGVNPNAASLNGEMVDEKGEISFPVLGRVVVAGLTVFEVQEKLQNLANKYLESPSIKIRLLNFRFTMLGEVKVEGTFSSLNNRVTLPEAIGLAGGLGELADRKSVKVIRYRNGLAEIGYVNLLDENCINSPFFYVHQGDTYIVPALRQRPFRNYFRENLTLFVSALSLAILIINLTK
jgi:polysaccharide biosynthesis/export protein